LLHDALGSDANGLVGYSNDDVVLQDDA
jgi:hypothetical protein